MTTTKPMLTTALAATLLMAAAVIATPAYSQTINDIDIMTEIYPPHNFKDEQGELRGISVDVMTLMLARMHAQKGRKDIKLLPWSRGYRKVLSDNNSCLFSMTRTKSRENLFQWVGPIIKTRVVIIAKKDRHLVLNNFDDLKKIRIGVAIEDVGEQLLLAGGIDKKSLDRTGGTNVLNKSLKKLARGRIDAIAYEDNATLWGIKKSGLQQDAYEVAYVLLNSELYYAFNKQTDPKVVQAYQDALDSIKKDGSYQKIVNRYR